MPKWLMALLIAIIQAIIKRASKEIREALPGWLDELEEKANQTPNTVDNTLVDFLREIFGLEKDALYKDG